MILTTSVRDLDLQSVEASCREAGIKFAIMKGRIHFEVDLSGPQARLLANALPVGHRLMVADGTTYVVEAVDAPEPAKASREAAHA